MCLYYLKTQTHFTLICACKDKPAFSIALQSWIEALDASSLDKTSASIVALDWSSHPPLENTLPSHLAQDPRLFILRVHDQSLWILSIAYNLAADFVYRYINRNTILVKLDCDTFLAPTFFQSLSIPSSKEFYAGNWRNAQDENDEHLNGVFAISLHQFINSGGFDERIQTYGYDDTNLYDRLQKLNHLIKLDFPNQTMAHLAHTPSTRTHRQSQNIYSPSVETVLNRLITEAIPLWTRKNIKSTNLISKLSQNRYEAQILTIPTQNKLLVNATILDTYTRKAFRRVLGLYGFYKSAYRKSMPISLLQKLERTYSEGPLLIIHVQHGLGNRIRALASAQALAFKTMRRTKIVWEADAHCGALFHDLFSNEEYDVYDHQIYKENLGSSMDFYNYMEAEPGSDKGKLIQNSENHIYVKSAYTLKSRYLKKDQIRAHALQLSPSKAVQKFISSVGNMSSCVGVHIRNRMPSEEIKNRNGDYPKNGLSDIVKYRKLSSTDRFINKIEEMISTDPKTCFFISADSLTAKQEIREKISKSAMIHSLDDFCDDRSAQCIQMALAELYILATTNAILGSPWSSFTEVAGLLSNKTPLLAGKDF